MHAASWFVGVALLSACYHYTHEYRAPTPGERVVRYKERVPTYINGFVGTGSIDVKRYCDQPIRTELKVRASDVLLSIATLLVYTPHTLYVTCPAARSPDTTSRR